MKIFFYWLHKNRRIIALLFIIFICIFASEFLFGIQLDAILYSLLLCAFFVVVFGVSDFIRFYMLHKRLCEISDNIDPENYDEMPSDNVIDTDYKQIINHLHNNFLSMKNDIRQRDTETEDYYTLWTHQIKTPISAMNLILSENTLDNKSIELLKSELFRIERYSEMTLQYTRLQNFSGDMVAEMQDIHDIVASALKRYALMFSIKKLSLTFENFEIKAVTDKKWLEFVIEQLLSNAVKYTKTGGIKIYAENNTLVIEDTGSGITKEDLPRIFEKSYTGYNGRMDCKASGLGLYLCKKITENLGHKINIQSEKNVGTKVSIDFSQEQFNQ